MAVDAATLLRHMGESFGGLPYPGDENIAASTDGSGDAERLRRALKGLHWRDVPFEVLQGVKSSVSSLSPEGFRFYLPACMTFCILDPSRADTIWESLVRMLTRPDASDVDKMRERMRLLPPQHRGPEQGELILRMMEEGYSSGEAERFFFEQVSLFDSAQGNVIREFLEYLRELWPDTFLVRDAKTAIARYWYQFGEGSADHGAGTGS